MLSKIIFGVQWVFIGLCSAVDAFLAIKLRDSLYEDELNPLGRLLMQWDGYDVALFMGVKFAGTVIALGILILAWHRNRKTAHIIIGVLTILNVALLVFLLAG
jgi:hypothetical protein